MTEEKKESNSESKEETKPAQEAKPSEVLKPAEEAKPSQAAKPAETVKPAEPEKTEAPASGGEVKPQAPAVGQTKAAEPVKKEKPSTCGGCGKSIKKKRWYYRNGKYYCTQRCWKTTLKKDAAAEEAGKEQK